MGRMPFTVCGGGLLRGQWEAHADGSWGGAIVQVTVVLI